MYSVNAEVFRAQNSPVNFASIPDGLAEPLVFIVLLYYIICSSMRSIVAIQVQKLSLRQFKDIINTLSSHNQSEPD